MPEQEFTVWDRIGLWIRSPLALVAFAFYVWMMIDAIRRREWGWLLFIGMFPGFGALWYFLYVYRGSPSATSGFELPGAQSPRLRAALNCPARITAAASRNSRRRSI